MGFTPRYVCIAAQLSLILEIRWCRSTSVCAMMARCAKESAMDAGTMLEKCLTNVAQKLAQLCQQRGQNREETGMEY